MSWSMSPAELTIVISQHLSGGQRHYVPRERTEVKDWTVGLLEAHVALIVNVVQQVWTEISVVLPPPPSRQEIHFNSCI